jgi:nucleoid-associated protein YgaU
MAVLRLVVLALDAYLLGATVVAVVFRVVHAERAVTVADLLTVPAVLRVVQAGLGIGFVGASVAAGASGSAGVAAQPTHADVALISVDDEPPTVRELPAHAASTTSTTTRSTTSTTVLPATTTTMLEPAPSLVEATPEPAAPTWLVQPGDHFWSIAERTLTTSWGRAPTDDEIVPYWHELIERNRDALADRDNANLIFPGQTFVLPAVPAAP